MGRVWCRRADNPSVMTLEGTNTWLIDTGDGVIVVDPGPDEDAHLDAISAAGDIALVLLTHHHHDHTDLVERLVARTSAPVRAGAAAWCRSADVLTDRERISLGGVTVEVIATPGHTADSTSFLVDGCGPRSLLTGDTVLGRGTTVILHPDGNLRDYLASLDALDGLGADRILPGHGAVIDEPSAFLARLRVHRLERLEQIRQALAAGHRGAPEIVRAVYGSLEGKLGWAAERSVEAQLAYLSERDA